MNRRCGHAEADAPIKRRLPALGRPRANSAPTRADGRWPSGTERASGVIRLSRAMSSAAAERDPFEAGATDTFTLTLPAALGHVESVRCARPAPPARRTRDGHATGTRRKREAGSRQCVARAFRR